jgi:hypothetical protein
VIGANAGNDVTGGRDTVKRTDEARVQHDSGQNAIEWALRPAPPHIRSRNVGRLRSH